MGPESKPPRARSASSTFPMSERSPRRVSRMGRRSRSRCPASPSISAWSSDSISIVFIAVRRQQKAPGKPSPGASVDGTTQPLDRSKRFEPAAEALSSDYTNMFDAAALRASMSPVRHPPTRGRKGRVEYSSATRCQEHACGVRSRSATTPRRPPARRRSRGSGSGSPLPHHDLSGVIGDCTI